MAGLRLWILLVVWAWSSVGWAQGLLDGLLGQPAKSLNIQTPELQLKNKLKKELAAVVKRIDAQVKREKALRLRWEKVLKRYRKMKARLEQQQPAFSSVQKSWLRAPGVLKKRKFLLKWIERHLALIGQLSSANDSFHENLQALREVLKGLLENDSQQLKKRVEKIYVKPRASGKLADDFLQLKVRLQKSQKDLEESKASLQELDKAKADNRQELRLSRKALIALESLKKPPVRRKAPSPPTTRPTSQRVAQKHKEKLEQELHRLEGLVRKLRFDLARRSARWLRLRERDEKLSVEVAEYRIQLYSSILKELKLARAELASRSRHGTWYFRALSLDSLILWNALHHTLDLVERTPKRLQATWTQKWAALEQASPWRRALLFLLFLAFLGGLGGVFVWRRRLWDSGEAFLQRMSGGKGEEPARALWGFVRLGLLALHRAIPYGYLMLLIAAVVWGLQLPGAWAWTLMALVAMVMVFRLVWMFTDQLFHTEPPLRLVAIDDAGAKTLRRSLKGSFLAALFLVPLLFAAHGLEFPEAFLHWVDLTFFAFILLSFFLVFLHKNEILELIPDDHVLGRLSRFFAQRLYPLLILFVLGLFGIYVYGYVNLAGFVARGVVLTLLVAGAAFGLYRLVGLLAYWLLGLVKGEKGVVQIERRWARNLFKFSQLLAGLLLSIFGLGLCLEIWKPGGGASLLLKALTTPLIQVKDTQLTVLSVGKFLLSFGVALWLAGFLKRKFAEYLYPAFRVSLANQHAIHTATHYTILATGLLFGLQWMGIGIGVLAVFAGVIGIGVGIGMQNIAGNFISGLIITFGKTIKVGDVIELEGTMGRVKQITARSTIIESHDLRDILIPNTEILTKKVVNWTKDNTCVMVPLDVGVAYGTDVQKVFQVLIAVVESHPQVSLQPPPRYFFNNFGDNALEFKTLIALADPMTRFEVLSDLRVQIDERFKGLGIVIAFPQRDLHFKPELESALISSLQRK